MKTQTFMKTLWTLSLSLSLTQSTRKMQNAFLHSNEMSYFSQKCLVATVAHEQTHLHLFYPYRGE